jgi:hypothetical protein
MSNNLKGTMEAYLRMVSEKKNLDPVDDKANDKKFKDRKDKDIDNDGDVDSSDEFLHKRRKAIDNKKDGGEKPATNEAVKKEEVEDEEEAPKKKVPPKKDGDTKDGETEAEKEDDDADSVEADGEGDAEKPKKPKKKTDDNPKTSDSTAEISKIGEGQFDAFIEMWSKIQEAADQKKGATPPEGIDDKESPKGKEFKAKHKVDKKDHEDMEKVEEPKERTVKKEMTEYEVIRQILSGKAPE